MRKILLIICAILTTTSVHATQMCARRDTTVIPLDAFVSADTRKSDGNEWMWWVSFDYGVVYGTATCLSVQDLRDIEGNQGLTTYVGSLSTDDEGYTARSGYYNGDTTNTEYERKFCYCKLTHPMASMWHYAAYPYTAVSCLSNCVGYCSSNVQTNISWRTELFNVIGYGYTNINDAEYTESIDL